MIWNTECRSKNWHILSLDGDLEPFPVCLESFRSLCVYVCVCFFLSGDIVPILIRLQSLYQYLAGQGG